MGLEFITSCLENALGLELLCFLGTVAAVLLCIDSSGCVHHDLSPWPWTGALEDGLSVPLQSAMTAVTGLK